MCMRHLSHDDNVSQSHFSFSQELVLLFRCLSLGYLLCRRIMMMIASITFKSSLVPLFEGLWSLNSWEFELSGFRRNRTDDLGIDSPSLWPTEPRLHVRSYLCDMSWSGVLLIILLFSEILILIGKYHVLSMYYDETIHNWRLWWLPSSMVCGILFKDINSCSVIWSPSMNSAGRPHFHVPCPACVLFWLSRSGTAALFVNVFTLFTIVNIAAEEPSDASMHLCQHCPCRVQGAANSNTQLSVKTWTQCGRRRARAITHIMSTENTTLLQTSSKIQRLRHDFTTHKHFNTQ